MQRSARGLTAALAVGVLGLPACGGTRAASVAPVATTSPATTTATTPPTTTTTSTTTTTTTTLAPTTTVATTTTEAPLPVPAPVPPAGTREPVVEVGVIEIPRIGVRMAMFSGITDATLDLGPGHWPGTALPGQLGNVVVAGHRVSKHQVFRHIDTLVPGDEIVFEVGGVRTVYEVTSSEVVLPDAIWIVDQSRDHTATLFACHPPGSTRERFVVHARLRAA